MNLNGIDKVCVLGATGFVGSSITNLLDSLGIGWKGVSRHNRNIQNIESYNLDSLHDQSALVELINEYPLVINALGSFKPADFEADTQSVFKQFWDNTNQLAKILSRSEIQKCVHISSGGTIYGETHGTPAHEELVPAPISWYGKAKLIEELLLEKAIVNAGARFVCARVTNPFGNTTYSNHGFVDVLLNQVLTGSRFDTFSDPRYTRDFIHCDDMARAILYLLNEDVTSSAGSIIFNVGAGESTSLHKIIEIVRNLKPDAMLTMDRKPTNYDVVQSAVDTSKLIAQGFDTWNFTSVEDYIIENLTGNL